MKYGVHLSAVELQEWADELVNASGESKKSLADKLAVSPSALTRATSEHGAKWFQLQVRIVELLTKFTIEVRTELVVGPKPANKPAKRC
jgi:hypothetical protein